MSLLGFYTCTCLYMRVVNSCTDTVEISFMFRRGSNRKAYQPKLLLLKKILKRLIERWYQFHSHSLHRNTATDLRTCQFLIYFGHRVIYRELTRRKKRNAVFTAHSCLGGECLYALAGIKTPASAQITFKFKKKLALACTYISFL